MGKQRLIDVERLLSRAPVGSLLDVGTGRGETLEIAAALGFHPVAGTETVPALMSEKVVMAYAHDLPYPAELFDVVTCFDVLEHLIEDDLAPAIKEFCRVAKKTIILSASEIPSSQWGGGRDLHISKRPKAEWAKLIKDNSSGWSLADNGTAGGSPVFVLTR
jgi:2-polyprenyl-3-methyl-5-hydroxy-6-metoxy-1,4-benzoquinol methylase